MNGGLTPTHALMPGSPAYNKGNNSAGLITDQRGPGFVRVGEGQSDVGAFESRFGDLPDASCVPANVTTFGDDEYQFTVAYADDLGIDVTTIGTGNVRVTGPGFGPVLPELVGIDLNTNGSPRYATYRFTPPGGYWDQQDKGAYVIEVVGQVSDIDLPPNTIVGGTIATFTVAVPNTFVVDEISDIDDGNTQPGSLSLREAIRLTNGTTSAETISFDPGVFAADTTITLTAGPLIIERGVSISGPLSKVTLDAAAKTPHFLISGNQSVSLTRLSLIRGFEAGPDFKAGSIWTSTSLTLNRVAISFSTVVGDGGAIAIEGEGRTLTINNSVLTRNAALGPNGFGGAVSARSSVTLSVTRSTIAENTASSNGGGLYLVAGNLTMTHSTVSANVANYSGDPSSLGGGGLFLGNVSMTMSLSTVSGNSAVGRSGGGIVLGGTIGTRTIRSSTIAFNDVGPGWGGGIAITTGNLALVNTIVAGNSAALGRDLLGPAGSAVDATNSLIGIADDGNINITGSKNLTGTSVMPLDALLYPLGDNGGPTRTHNLSPLSPARDTGISAGSGLYDQRGPLYRRNNGGGHDIGSVELQASVITPTVTSFHIGNGTLQRSAVPSITIAFSTEVTFPNGIAEAFQLKRTGPGTPTGPVSLNINQSGATVTITFAPGGGVNPEASGSLPDGHYQFVARATQIAAKFGNITYYLDGNADGISGDDFVAPLHRLFGDGDGDEDVDINDWSAFRATYGSSSFAFDFDNDGDVDTADLAQFRVRFSTSI